MKLSSKIQKCELSPIRKYAPYADAARARGIKIYPLNIGQPDIETPVEFFNAVREFKSPVLEYAPSGGVPVYLKAVHDYYTRIGLDLERATFSPPRAAARRCGSPSPHPRRRGRAAGPGARSTPITAPSPR